jgi:hypothetical protein
LHMNEIEMDERDIARLLSVGRVAFGALMILAPRRAARLWTGENEDSAISAMAVRGLGARDLAIGMGTLVALEEDGGVAGWLRAGVVSDAGDALAVLSNFGRLRGLRRWALLATSCTAVYAGLKVADGLS